MTYTDLEQALKNKETVQRCMINQHGKAVQWNDVPEINRAFDTGRYRIIKNNCEIIDGIDQ